MDLTPLISTIITSVAALVAIVGGLLVSRVISLANDQHFYNREIETLDMELKPKEEELEVIFTKIASLTASLEKMKINDFFTNDTLEAIYANESLENILTEKGLPKNEQYESLYKSARAMCLEIEQAAEAPEFDCTYATLAQINPSLRYAEDKQLAPLYARLCGVYLNAKFGKLFSMVDTERFTQNLALVDNYPSLLSGYTAQSTLENDLAHQMSKKRDNQAAITYLKKQRTHLVKASNRYVKTSGVWIGLLVLVVSSCIGIVYPAILLAYPDKAYSEATTKLLLICLFITSLLLLFLYIGGYLLNVTRNKVKDH